MIELKRKTAETEIALKLDLNGRGKARIDTGIGFFNHMLELFCLHGFIDLELTVRGDLDVDEHHTVEDTGILLGQAIRQSLGDKKGIRRYGSVTLPMDEVVVQVVLDLSGRPYFLDDLTFSREKVGGFPVELFAEFFRALSFNAGLTLHFLVLRNGNTHHLIEACFKASGRALDQAIQIEERLADNPLSTKGILQEGDSY